MVETKANNEIDPILLIRTVRKYDALYDSNAEGYSNKIQKETIWEDVIRTVFPKFDLLSRTAKENIRANVKRRWKSLRNLMAKEVKKSTTIENYMRKKESVLLDEMEFLLPHIKTVSQGSKTNGYSSFSDVSYTYGQDSIINEDDDGDDCIDLTDDLDMKPYMKLENDSEYDMAVYPIAELGADSDHHSENNHLHEQTVATTTQASPTTNWRTEFCTISEYRSGVFSNSTVVSPHPTACDSSNDLSRNDSDEYSCKRSRVDTEDDSTNTAALQKRIFQLLANIERRDKPEPEKRDDAHDEDRMFLLSLVSDLRRVPASRKMLVKAEIATVIARAMSSID